MRMSIKNLKHINITFIHMCQHTIEDSVFNDGMKLTYNFDHSADVGELEVVQLYPAYIETFVRDLYVLYLQPPDVSGWFIELILERVLSVRVGGDGDRDVHVMHLHHPL